MTTGEESGILNYILSVMKHFLVSVIGIPWVISNAAVVTIQVISSLVTCLQ